MIAGLIFDCDGLILDTEMSVFQSWQEIYRDHGCELTVEEWSACVGGTDDDFDVYAHLESLTGRPVDRAALAERNSRRERELTDVLPCLPGVERYIEDARQLGLKLGMASNSPRDWVVGHLERLGLAHYFDTVVCRDDADRAKPAPDLYRLALQRLGLRPEQVIALEDSPHGINAAQAAGIWCVAIPNALTCGLPISHADLRLESMEEMPLSELLAISTRCA